MGKFTEYVKGAVKALNPFSHSFGINNNLCISEEDFSRILTRVLFKRLLIDVFTKLGYASEKQQRRIEKIKRPCAYRGTKIVTLAGSELGHLGAHINRSRRAEVSRRL